jgi:hypothetical protein
MKGDNGVSAMELIMQLEGKVRKARKELVQWQARCIMIGAMKVGPWVTIGIGIGTAITWFAWYMASRGHVCR